MAPNIFLAFSNQQNDYLEMLKEEDRGIWDVLIHHKLAGALDFVNRGHTSARDIIDSLTSIQQSIEIFHYGGHASHFHLELDQGEEYNLEKLVALLALCPQLKLIFLNGCSTWGIVEKIKAEPRIKAAVIATYMDIPDRQACEFALNFYMALTGGPLGGATIEDAFDFAAAHLSDERRNHLHKGAFSRGAGQGAATPASHPALWGLYYSDTDIIRTKLVHPGQPTQAIDPDLKQFLQDINVNIRAEHQKLDTIRKKCTLLRQLAAFDDHSYNQLKQKLFLEDKLDDLPLLKALKEQYQHQPIEEVRLEREQSLVLQRSTLATLLMDKRKRIEDLLQNRHQDKLKAAFFNINYDYQKPKIFNRIKQGQLFNAFFIRGQADSAHNLLIQSIIRHQFIEYETKQIRLNFNPELKASKAPETEVQLWQRLIDELYQHMGTLPKPTANQPPETIIRHIYEHFPGTIVLTFDNLPEVFLEQKIGPISAFCQHFFQFQDQHPKDRHPHYGQINLFINIIQWAQTKPADWYEQQQPTVSPPIIDNLKPPNLVTWQTQAGLYLDPEKYDQLVGPNGKPILPAIRSICEHIHRADIYQTVFSQFECNIKPNRL